MPEMKYLIPRVIRHFMPDKLVRMLLLRSWIIRPGLETNDPGKAAEVYLDTLKAAGINLVGRRVLLFGYGGRFGVGCALLHAGAQHVLLCEKGAPPDNTYNRQLLAGSAEYLLERNGQVLPRPELMTLLQGDIRQMVGQVDAVDVVLSTSVYEHLNDVEGITAALAALTRPNGVQLHFVDLRDHFFKYPFEMLCYDEATWRTWFNPTSNHNRYRLWDYQRVFDRCFAKVKIQVNQRDADAFDRTRERIRPEFISGNDQIDSVTLIQVLATLPLHPTMGG